MSAIVRDITPSFFAFWERAKEREPEEQQRLWYALYEEPHSALFAICDGRHGLPKALPAALARFPADIERLRVTISQVRAAVESTGPELERLFGFDRLVLRWVLLVGMYWSDGWMVELAGHPTCYIAVEMLETPRRAEIVLLHEAAHVAHQACLGDAWEDLVTLAAGLFLEGLATLASQRMVPGFDEAIYLWAGKTETRHGQRVSDWLTQCEAAWPMLRSQLLSGLRSTKPEHIAPYFRGDHGPEGLPTRVGYYAGYRLVAALAKEHSVADLARWPSERIQREIERQLRA